MKGLSWCLPETVQVTKIDLLPEAAANTVTDPADDGENPQSYRDLGQTQSLLVSAAEEKKNKVIDNKTLKPQQLDIERCLEVYSVIPSHLQNQCVEQVQTKAV